MSLFSLVIPGTTARNGAHVVSRTAIGKTSATTTRELGSPVAGAAVQRGGNPKKQLAGAADPRREGVAHGDSRPRHDWFGHGHIGPWHFDRFNY